MLNHRVRQIFSFNLTFSIKWETTHTLTISNKKVENFFLSFFTPKKSFFVLFFFLRRKEKKMMKKYGRRKRNEAEFLILFFSPQNSTLSALCVTMKKLLEPLKWKEWIKLHKQLICFILYLSRNEQILSFSFVTVAGIFFLLLCDAILFSILARPVIFFFP